jgi:alpha-tubulin suppressor-like RCC1 family protein/formylglycine-generating enzyme required for sulfatase activity
MFSRCIPMIPMRNPPLVLSMGQANCPPVSAATLKLTTLLALILCAARSSATAGVLSFGSGNLGLATGDTTATVATPIDTTNLGSRSIMQLAAGYGHNLLLADDGSVFSFGSNVYGQLGLGTQTTAAVATPIDMTDLGGRQVTQVAAGTNHSLLLTDDGTVFAFGQNTFGQLGLGTTASLAPVKVPTPIDVTNLGGRTITQISAGSSHSLLLADDGSVFAMGSNSSRSLGLGIVAPSGVKTPTPISTIEIGGRKITQVAGGSGYSLLLADDGTVFSFGDNYEGRTGLGLTYAITTVASPIDVTNLGGRKIIQMAAGATHSLLLADDGTVFAMGENTSSGYLGVGSQDQYVPIATQIDTTSLGDRKVVQIAAGNRDSFLLADNGTMFALGINLQGQLGIGTADAGSYPSPIPINGMNLAGLAVTHLATNYSHSLLIAVPQIPEPTTLILAVVGLSLCIARRRRRGDHYQQSAARVNLPRYSTEDLDGGAFIYTNVFVSLMALACCASIVSIAARSACADSAVAWGNNAAGQLGDGTDTWRYSPINVNGLTNDVTAIDAGVQHTLAIVDGGLYAWGQGTYGKLGDGGSSSRLSPFAVTSLPSGITAVSGGGNHSMAIVNGGVYAWGSNGYGQIGHEIDPYNPLPVEGMDSGVTAISAGAVHSLALKDGGVYAWGYNVSGQLGLGYTTDPAQGGIATPTPVLGLTSGVSTIAAGWSHSLAIKDGIVYAWGYNFSGQLGDGTSGNSRNTPVPVMGLPGEVTAIAAGATHSLAVAGSHVYAWGDNSQFEVDTFPRTIRTIPVEIDPAHVDNIVAVAAGHNVSYALSNDGSLWVWGQGSALGLGSPPPPGTPAKHLLPPSGYVFTSIDAGDIYAVARLAAVPEPASVMLIAIGAAFTLFTQRRMRDTRHLTVAAVIVSFLAILAAQSARADSAIAWGANSYGQVGDGTTSDYRSVPTAVRGLVSGVTDVAVGREHSLAVVNGAAYAWGHNGSNQLGDGTILDRHAPVAVSGLTTGVTDVAAGNYYSLAVKDGAVYAWGYNFYGLGDGAQYHETPVPINVLTSSVTVIAAGREHNLAIQNGAAYAWGNNIDGRLGTTINGYEPFGNIAAPVAGLSSGVTAVAAGGFHSLAVQNGAAYSWGYNIYGALGNGTKGYGTNRNSPGPVTGLSSGVTAVAAGGYHSLAVKNGFVYAWGFNGEGVLGDGTLTEHDTPILVDASHVRNIVAVAASTYNSYALSSDGSLWVWGSNPFGQLGLIPDDYSSLPHHLLPPTGYIYTSIKANPESYHAVATLETVPEPSIVALVAIGTLCLVTLRWRVRALSLMLMLGTLAFVQQAAAVTIYTVPIGNPGNPADTRFGPPGPHGAVSYSFRMGTTEVTNAQYAVFLNAVAAADPYGLYNTEMDSEIVGNIVRNGSPGNYSYTVKAPAIGHGPGGSDYTYENKPVGHLSWGDAARFANWLHNGQPNGAQDASTTEDGAYTLNGAMSDNALAAVTRNAGARWWLPNAEEWYKAAYYDSTAGLYHSFATGDDSWPDNNRPANDTGNSANYYGYTYCTDDFCYPLTDAGAYTHSGSPYGTFDQNGNVFEWSEIRRADFSPAPWRDVYGGSYGEGDPGYMHANVFNSLQLFPSDEFDWVGFRVATIPDLPGDFNHDGAVDAADYIAWRKSSGSQDDYNTWRVHFGQTFSFAGSGSGITGREGAPAVPEPATIILLSLAMAGCCLRRDRYIVSDFVRGVALADWLTGA